MAQRIDLEVCSHQLNLKNKVITHYARPDLGERCLVYLLKLYLSKLPKVAYDKDIFYWKELKAIPTNPDSPWYKESPIGHNTLTKKLKESANVSNENKTNHSLRATAISRMFNEKVPEKIIMEHWGHLSKEGVRCYERTTDAQEKRVSDIRDCGSNLYVGVGVVEMF